MTQETDAPRRGWLYHALKHRWGLLAVVGVVTLLSVAASAFIAYGVTYWALDGSMGRDSWMITVLCPLFIAPGVSWAMFAVMKALYLTQDRLHELTVRDGLTQLHNRRYFMQALADELERVRRYGGPLSVAMIDIDDFKQVNDRHGHGSGDDVLCSVARNCSAVLRQTDVFARIGGEEFALLLPQTEMAAALVLFERVRKTVAAHTVPVEGQGVGVTVSIGVVGVDASAPPWSEVLRAVDQALYQAKREGKDRVVARSVGAAA